MILSNTIGHYWKHTISRDLIIGLSLTIFFVISILSGLYFLYSTAVAKRKLQELSVNVTEEFAQNIARPLSHFDFETIRHIARAFLQSKEVGGIKVTVDSTVLFERHPGTSTDFIRKEKEVILNGETVGLAELLFTKEYIQEGQKSLIRIILIILPAVILVIIITTHFLLKGLLSNPLHRLVNGIRAIAKGDYQRQIAPVSQNDINKIIQEINIMAGLIAKRSQDLIESEDKYRSIFVNAAEGIYQSSVDGRFISVNPAMARILGYESPDDLIGSITDLATQLYVDPQQRKDFMHQIQKNKTVSGYELQFYRKDKSKIWVTLDSRAVFNERGEVVYFEGIVMDITDRKQMEMALQKAHEELELKVDERTMALKEKTAKLTRMNKLFIDRELRMKKLKQEIKILKPKPAKGET